MRAYLAPLGVLLIYGLCSAAKEVNGKHDERSVGHRRDVPQRATKYRIATILSKPYVMHDASQKLVGFIPDLVEEISILLDFDYEFILYTSYGRDLGNTYDGMIGGLNAKENGNESAPDFAAADLTVTSSRRAVVDFVHPFDDIGLTIIIQKPYYDAKTDAFSILDFDPFTFTVLSPLTVEVWALIIFCTLVVALALWAINKFNPYEWQGRYDVGIASKEEAEAFNLPSSLWFAFTTLQWQGFEKAPRSWSGKVLSIFWFIFVTIVIVTYTAGIVNNLFFASLVHERDPLFNRIHSLAELVQHPHGYSYGVIKGGSTHAYLDVAIGEEFNVIRNHIASEEGQKDLVRSMEQGIDKVRSGKYAFIVESPTAKYLTNQRPCDLMTVGEVFAKRNFGMATPKGSNLTEELDKAILSLRESVTIQQLEDKWFIGEGQCWNVTSMEKALNKRPGLDINQAKKVDIHIFSGPLIILIIGLVVSAIVLLTEIVWYKTRGKYAPSNQPHGKELQADTDDAPEL